VHIALTLLIKLRIFIFNRVRVNQTESNVTCSDNSAFEA
jgi:hypothetical protein